MYIWSLKKLANAIATNSLSEKSKIVNLITSVLILLIISLVNLTNTYKTTTLNNNFLNIISIVNLFLLIVGIIYCYIQNRSVDNSNFIERLILFSLPSMVRVIIVSLALGIIIGIAQPAIQIPNNSISLKIQLGGIGIGCSFLFFLWVSSGIIMIGKIKSKNN